MVFVFCNMINKIVFNDILYGNTIWESVRYCLFMYILIIGIWEVSTNTIWNSK